MSTGSGVKVFKGAVVALGCVVVVVLLLAFLTRGDGAPSSAIQSEAPDSGKAEEKLTLAYLDEKVFPGEVAVVCKPKDFNAHTLIGCRAVSSGGKSMVQLWVWESGEKPEFLALNGSARGVFESKFSLYGDFGQVALPVPDSLSDLDAAMAMFN